MRILLFLLSVCSAFLLEAQHTFTLLNQKGDTIQTGIPIVDKGIQLASEHYESTQTIPGDTQIISYHQSIPRQIPQKIHLDFPAPSSILNLESSTAPKPKIVPAKAAIYPVKHSKPLPVLAFRRKDKTVGELQYLDIEQGLISSTIHHIIEDSKGFIWLGTNMGLSKYDGKMIRHYGPENGLQKQEVFYILEDHNGNLWLFHGQHGGMTMYDGQSFHYYEKSDDYNLSGIWNPSLDSKKQLWFGVEGGVAKFDGQQFFFYTDAEGFTLKKERVIETPNGDYWFHTPTGISYFNGKQFTNYNLSSFFDLDLFRIRFIDTSETLWMSGGQKICKLKNDQLECFEFPFEVEHFIQGDQTHYWATPGDGFGTFDGVTYQYFTEDDGLRGKEAYPSLRDQFGQVWLKCYDGGIHLFNPNSFKHLPVRQDQLFSHNQISSIIEDRKGNIWLGSHGNGLAMYKDDQFTIFPTFNQYDYITRALYQDSKGVLWLGISGNGLFKYDGKKFSLIKKIDGHRLYQDYAITEDLEGNLWVGSAPGGLLKYDGKTFTHFPHNNDADRVRALLTDQQGRIWIGSQGGGIRMFDGKHFTYYTTNEGLSSNNVVSLLEDHKGNIWVGTSDGGVNRFDGKTFKKLSTKDGLSSDAIWTITEDSNHYIWLGADYCLDVINAEDTSLNLIASHCDLDGLRGGEFYANASIIDQSGQMWWCTNKMVTKGKSDQLIPIDEPPRIFLENIEIAQHFVDFRQLEDSIKANKNWWTGKNQQLNLAELSFDTPFPFFNYPNNLKLPNHFNNLTFHFSASNYPELDKVKFSYFIKGVDSEWSIPNLEPQANYRGLAPGTYTFQVKAKGLESLWSESINYTFTILPPWWQTWSAYLVYLGIIGGGIYWLYKFNLNRKLEQAETKRVKELNNIKTRLYTNITHEFRTPLTVIMGMNENVKGNEQEKKLIRRNSKNLLRLVNQLLDLSKLESGTMKMDQVQGDIIIYLQFLAESFYSMAEEKNIRLTFYSEVDELIMDYDEVKIQHIVYNLISNAIKFTPRGGKVILHLNKETEADFSQLKLKVKDTGIGISKDKIPHIFDRFYQVDGSHTRKGEGTGIGLALTKELIEMMDGTIEVNSIEDKGTKIIIFLPIINKAKKIENKSYDAAFFKEQAKDFVPIVPNEKQLDIPVADEQFKAEILIIEDNPDVAMYIESLLRPDYKVHIAIDGQKGIDTAVELVPDMIISDVMMPEKDGYEVCQTLKQDARTSHIPIILLTAKAAQEDKVQGLQFGADAFLTKPFDKSELLIRVNKLIEIRQRLQEKYSTIVLESSSNLKATNQVKIKNTLEDNFIQEISKVVEQHYTNPSFGVNDLAKAMFMSHTQVYRKLKALTGKTPSQFIRSIRLQRGKELLLSSEMNVSEIAYEIGFADPSYFSRTFQQEFGTAPRDIRRS